MINQIETETDYILQISLNEVRLTIGTENILTVRTPKPSMDIIGNEYVKGIIPLPVVYLNLDLEQVNRIYSSLKRFLNDNDSRNIDIVLSLRDNYDL